MNGPLCYDLCNQRVTVYRLAGEKVLRQVTENAFLSYGVEGKPTPTGEALGAPFRLILPADEGITLQPGDRVYPGEGPKIEAHQWSGFLPATVPGLSVVTYVKPYFFLGEHCHTEAGNP